MCCVLGIVLLLTCVALHIWRAQKSGGHDLLNGVSEKDLANIVKDALFVDRIKDELRGLLKREPTMAEWAKAVGMEPR